MNKQNLKKLGIIAISLLGIAFSQPVRVHAETPPTVEYLGMIFNEMDKPMEMELDPGTGDIYVASSGNRKIIRFDKAGRLIASRTFPAAVNGVALAQDGRLLVTQKDRIAVCDKEMTKVGEIGVGEFSFAYGIAIDESGYFYVTDSWANKVRIYTASGQFVKSFGNAGHGNGQFMTPTAIVYEKAADQIVVVDTNNYRVQFFTTAGVHVKTISKNAKYSAPPYPPVPGSNPLQFTLPMGVAFEYGTDPATGKEIARRMYVTDSFQAWVQVIDPNYKDPTTGAWGQFLSFIRYAEGASGDMYSPTDAVFDGINRRLLISNNSYYISIYGIDGGKTPPASEPPVLIIDTAPARTNQGFIILAGSVGAGATVTVANAADSSSGTATVSGTTWSYQLTLVPGTNSITVIATDPATGLTTTKTADITYLAPLSLTLNPLSAYSNTPAQLLSGTVDSGASVIVTNVTSGATAAATVVNGTIWSCQIPLVAGGNSLTVNATKTSYVPAGASVIVTLDAVAPELGVTGPADNSYTNIPAHTISGTVADANLHNVSVNGQAVTITDGTFSTTVTLVEGANTITVAASDLAGNVTTNSRTVTYDAMAPALTVSALTSGSYTNNPTQNITGTVVDANFGQVTVNGQAVELVNGVFSTPLTLNMGANDIIVTAADLAGNMATDSRTIIFDNTAPTITITAPADGSYTREGIAAVSGSVDETVTYVDVNGTGVQMNGTGWNSTVTLAQGLNTIEVVAMDLAGNIGSAKRSVIYDNVAPQVAISVPNQDLATNSASITVSGAASDAEPFTLTGTVNGASSEVALTDGAYNLDVVFPAEGTWPIVITATDAAGNASSAIRTVTYDATPPALTIDPVNTARPAKLAGTVEPGAIVVVRDKNGLVTDRVMIAAGAWSADLSSATYDLLSLAAVAVDPAGNAAIRALTFKFPDGDLNGDGAVTLTDFQIAQRIWNHELAPTAEQLAQGDIGPLVNGLPCPDGRIDKTDAELIQQKATGKIIW